MATSRSKIDRTQSVCPECGAKEVIDDEARGERICARCGLILVESIIDKGAEWRAFTAEERSARARTGAPMNLMIPDKGLSTTIPLYFRDASGRAVSGQRRAEIYRMRKWQIRSIAHSSQMRNLRIALSELERLSSILGVPHDTKETASMIYRKALSKRLIRGRSIEGMTAAAIYLSCRIHNIPRQLDELAIESDSSRREIGKSVRQLLRYLDMKIPIPSAKDLLPRVSGDLKLKGTTISRASNIITDAKEIGLTDGKNPGGIAGAAIYIAGILSEDRRTQREIAEALKVTEVTIRNRYKELIRVLGIEAFEP